MVAVGLSVSVFPNPASPLAIGAAVATRSALTPKSRAPPRRADRDLLGGAVSPFLDDDQSFADTRRVIAPILIVVHR